MQPSMAYFAGLTSCRCSPNYPVVSSQLLLVLLILHLSRVALVTRLVSLVHDVAKNALTTLF